MVEISRAVEFELEQQVRTALEGGDAKHALQLLMTGYGKSIYRYCCHMLRDPDLAGDVLQTTFLQAFEDFDRFQSRSSISTWLFGIATHRCLDALKSRRRRWNRSVAIDEVKEPLDARRRPDEAAATNERHLALKACLGELDPRIRAAVLLRFQNESSYVDMAAVCGDAPATLQARVARAMPALRRCLEAKGIRP